MSPKIIKGFPFFQPSPYGMSVVLTSPVFLYAFRAKIKEKLVKASWLAIGLTAIPIFLHFTQGWVQFGYRFLLDFVPFLLILIAKGMGKKVTPLKLFLVLFSVAVNLWGVYWGKILGW